MNAVKRCLALIAATLVVGACGGDPTAGDAGADLHIRATPGAVWVRNGSSATVNIEAVDKLGGPVEGHWSVGTIVGPFTASIDTAFQNTSVGQLDVKARFIITPTAEGEGSVEFTGTGGTDTVPVRVAPDTGLFNATVSPVAPTNGQLVTVTAPAGIIFAPSVTTVRFFAGPLPLDSSNGGLTFPGIGTFAADSGSFTFIAGPSAHGVLRITGIASRSTPGLQTTARTITSVTAPAVDTTILPITLSNATPTVVDTEIATIAAPYRFTAAGEPYTITPTSGGANAIVLSYSPDSTQVKLVIPPGASGKLRSGRVVYAAAPSAGFAGRSANTLAAAAPPPLAAVFSNAAPAANATMTVTMPAGFKFRPTSVLSGTTGISFIVVSRTADSSQVTILPLPGYSGAVKITNVLLSAAPGFALTLNSVATITVGAVASLGADDPAGVVPIVQTPAALNAVTGFWDLATMGATDYTGDTPPGGTAQFYRIHSNYSGSMLFNIDWNQGTASNTDIDAVLVLDDGSWDTAVAGAGGAATGAKPENGTFTLVSGTTYVLAVIDFGPFDGGPFTGVAATTPVRVTMTAK